MLMKMLMTMLDVEFMTTLMKMLMTIELNDNYADSNYCNYNHDDDDQQVCFQRR